MRPQIICLTPVKNEAWILDSFLKATSIWADYIIVADQNSNDGSKDIARKYSKVILVENNIMGMNELDRQVLLISEARKIPGPKLLFGLDADEFLSPEAFDINNWDEILLHKPGTIFNFQWATISPNSELYRLGYPMPLSYIDDGADHDSSQFFHISRIPTPKGHDTYNITRFKVIHVQLMNPQRKIHKTNWYQCLELDHPSIASDAIDIYRKYHHDFIESPEQDRPIPQIWIDQYSNIGIDLKKIYSEKTYWYDDEMRLLFNKNGYSHYKKLSIWDDTFKEHDPRNIIDKLIHFWLKKSQSHYFTKARKIDNIIRKILHY